MGEAIEAEVNESDGSTEKAPAPVDAKPLHFVYGKQGGRIKFAVGFAGWLVTNHVKGPSSPVRDGSGLPLFVAAEIDPPQLRKLLPRAGGAFNLMQCQRDPDGFLVAIDNAEAAYCEVSELAAPTAAAAPGAATATHPPDVVQAAFEMVGKALEEQRLMIKEAREALTQVARVNREHATAILEAFAPRVKLREDAGKSGDDELSEDDSKWLRETIDLAKPLLLELSPELVKRAKRWISSDTRNGHSRGPEIDVTPKAEQG